MRISVIVPVYRDPKQLADIARKVASDTYGDKEMIIAIDGPMTPEIKGVLDGLDDFASVRFPDEHLGKAETLNRTVAELSTDIVLFLDNDIELPSDPRFLSSLVERMATCDILDLPKEVVVESLYSAMIGFEYHSMAIASWVFSRLAKRSPGLIGAAFAVKKDLFDRLGGFRRVVHEDGDFGARAFRLRACYRYDLDLKVKTTMPNTLKEWIVQRKRWTTINVYWFRDNFLDLLASVFRQPSLLPALGLMVLPSILSLAAFVVLDKLKLSFVKPLLFMLEHPVQLLAGVLIWFSHHRLYSDGLISTALGFLTTTGIYFSFSRMSKFRFDILPFFLFYFLYMPLLAVINVGMFAFLLFKRKIGLEWKV